MQKIDPCLWFDGQAEEAAKLYSSVFKNCQIKSIVQYPESGAKASGQKKGSVMTVEFVLENLRIVGLNGGPNFKFNPAFSLFVWCETEEENARTNGEGDERRDEDDQAGYESHEKSRGITRLVEVTSRDRSRFEQSIAH